MQCTFLKKKHSVLLETLLLSSVYAKVNWSLLAELGPAHWAGIGEFFGSSLATVLHLC